MTLIDGNSVTYPRLNPYNDGLNDDLVPTNDGDNIFSNITSNNKIHYRIKKNHVGVIKEPITYAIINSRINNLPEGDENEYKIW